MFNIKKGILPDKQYNIEEQNSIEFVIYRFMTLYPGVVTTNGHHFNNAPPLGSGDSSVGPPSLELRGPFFGMTRAGVKWREIGRPPGNLAIEKYAYGHPISLRLTDDDLSFRPRDRNDSEGSKGGTS